MSLRPPDRCLSDKAPSYLRQAVLIGLPPHCGGGTVQVTLEISPEIQKKLGFT